MKLLPVWLFVYVRSGRPSAHGALFSTHLADQVDSDVNLKDAKCFPQNTQIDGDWRRQCITAPECCSERITKSATRTDGKYVFVCGCIPAGKPFKDESECCSGEASKHNPGKCGCLGPDTGPQKHQAIRKLKLNASDCCYAGPVVRDQGSSVTAGISKGYRATEFDKCGPRICTGPGASKSSGGWWMPKNAHMVGKAEADVTKGTGICCGGSKENDAGLCTCIKAGTVTNPLEQMVKDSFCCSGKFTPGTTTCGCIPDSHFLPGHGADLNDCCSKMLVPGGWEDHDVCAEAKCVKPHNQKPNKGSWCCTDKAPKNKYKNSLTNALENNWFAADWCPCVKGGTKVDEGDSDYCCSGKVDRDGKCTWISYDNPIQPDYMTADECFSGRAEYDRCLCMKPGDPKRGDLSPGDKQECCSNALSNKRCSCIFTLNRLRTGSNSTDCCSELSDGETCQCAPIGTQLKQAGVTNWDCCSETKNDGFCACVGGGEIAKAPRFCCTPPQKGKPECGCKEAGEAVPASSSASASCCSGTAKDLDGHDGHCSSVKVCS